MHVFCIFGQFYGKSALIIDFYVYIIPIALYYSYAKKIEFFEINLNTKLNIM